MNKQILKWEFLIDDSKMHTPKCLFTVYREAINKKGMPYSNIYVKLFGKEERVYSLCYFKRKEYNSYTGRRVIHNTVEIALFETSQLIIEEVEKVISIDYKEALNKYYKWLKHEKDRVDRL